MRSDRLSATRYRTGGGIWVAIGLWLAAAPAWGDAWLDTHDSPEPVWRIAEGDTGARLLNRERVRVGKEEGDLGAEQLTYEAATGQSAWLWRDIPAAVVIDELKVEIDARLSRPGVVGLLELRLPRSIDPETKKPLRIVTRSRPADWSPKGDARIVFDNLPQRVEREARALRLSRPDQKIDPRGAELLRVGLIAAGGVGQGRVWVREVRVAGLVSPRGVVVRRDETESEQIRTDAPSVTNKKDVGGTFQPTEVSLRSEGFVIDGEPFFPRIWRWRGESLERLVKRGVNTLWIDHPPEEDLLDQAARLRLRLITPPPRPEEAAAINASWAPVLAWAPPEKLDRNDVDAQLALIEQVRALTQNAQRPFLAHIAGDADQWSRVADGMLIETKPDTGAGAEDQQALLRRQLEGVAPGTPVLAVIPIDVGRATQRQLDALLGEGVANAWLPPGDVAAATHAALGVGVRGLAWFSTEPIDGADEATEAAANWLEITNRRLRLIEPWLVATRGATTLSDEAGEAAGALLQRDGVRLALASPFVGPSGTGLVLPGVSDAVQVHRLTPAGISPWPTRRVAGGLRVDRTGGSKPGGLLISNDRRVTRSLREYLGRTGAPAAERMTALAEQEVRRAESLDKLARPRARRRLAEAKLALARRDHATAYDAAHAALEIVETASGVRRAIARDSSLIESSPLAILPATLTDHFRMQQLLSSASRGPNRLHGGSFEDIDELRRHGWRHPASHPRGEVELATETPVHGERRLRLVSETGARRGERGPRVVSPPIELKAGETVEITGWARVEGDGRLLLRDSLGEEELQLSLAASDDWRPFRLLRRTSDAVVMTLTLEMTGPGTAGVDGLMIRPIEPLGVASRQSAAQPK